MKLMNRTQFEFLMEEFPNGGIVFAEYTPDVLISELMVTDGHFGATCVRPVHGEVCDEDWCIGECMETDLFVVFDNNDVLQMIKTLTKGLKINLLDEE